MNQEQRNQLGKIIAATALYYQRQINTEVISMMVDDLEDLNFERIVTAYKIFRRDPKNKFFPLPAQIREIICPAPSPQAEARDVIESIKFAIAEFGWPEGVKAREVIGEIGWNIVEGMGGWTRICESDFIHNPGLIAQARNRAEDLITYDMPEHTHTALPAPPEYSRIDDIENQKQKTISEFERHKVDQELKGNPKMFDIPTPEERARLIKELLEKNNRKELL